MLFLEIRRIGWNLKEKNAVPKRASATPQIAYELAFIH